MNNLKAGFGRVNITPPMGISIRGYFKPRYADGVLDELEINALALQSGETKTLLLTVDHCGIEQNLCNDYIRLSVMLRRFLQKTSLFQLRIHILLPHLKERQRTSL